MTTSERTGVVIASIAALGLIASVYVSPPWISVKEAQALISQRNTMIVGVRDELKADISGLRNDISELRTDIR